MTTTPPSITPPPAAPDQADRSTFSTRAYPWSAALPTFGAQIAAVAVNVKANADEAAGSATTATAAATAAAGSALVAGAVAWVSGTTYAIGDARYGLVDYQTYRRKTAGAGTIDPASDPTNWTKAITGSGGGGTTITGSVTLTAASPAAMTVTPAAPGMYITLPDATTCTKANNLFAVYNAGDFDYGVKDSAGTQLGWIRARTGAMIGLSDSSAAAGVWASYGLEKTGITASYVNSTLANMSNTIRRIALDANRTCFLFGGAACYAIVYDASTQTWGVATLVQSNVVWDGAFLGVLSATNQVLVVSGNLVSNATLAASTLTISGNVITVNAAVTVTLAGAMAASALGQLIAVGSSWVIGYSQGASTIGIRAITVSGTTPTIGVESALVPAGLAPPLLFASGSVVRTLSTDGSSISCKPFTVSGSTLSAGTAASVGATAAAYRAFLNGNGNIVCGYANASLTFSIFKLTGTTEAASTTAGTGMLTASIATWDFLQVAADKTALFMMTTSSRSWRCYLLTDNAGTASLGSMATGTSFAANITQIGALTVSGNLARFSYAQATATAEYSQITLDCSAASPTLASQITVTAQATADPTIFASDAYGVRPANLLIVSQSCSYLGGAAKTFDLRVTPNSVQRAIAAPVSAGGYSMTGVPAASNEAWLAGTASFGGFTGYLMQRVESAA